MSWRCDTCGAAFGNEDIPEECPKCGTIEGTFSLMEKEEKKE